MARSYVHLRRVRKQKLEYLRKVHVGDCKVGAGDWLAQNSERSKDFYTGKLPDSPDSGVYAPSTHESDEDDVDCGALIDRADQRDHMSQTGSSIAAQPLMHGQNELWQGHW